MENKEKNIPRTKEDLRKLEKEDLIELIFLLIKENQELKEEIASLKKNSKTSSKPPSSDSPYAKNQSLRKKSNKKSWGQKWQERRWLKQSETPDKIIKCEPEKCNKCGKWLWHIKWEIKSRRQEKDIPPIKIEITEYQEIEKKCKCGCKNVWKYPENIKAPIQIWENAKVFMTYLNIIHYVWYERLVVLSEDLFWFPISEWSIWNIIGEVWEKAEPIKKEIMEQLQKSEWMWSDETWMKVNGKNNWLWTWQNPKYSYYAIEEKRNYEVVKNNLWEEYNWKIVHDCWSAQNNTIAKWWHQQCHPHLQRPLEFLIVNYKSKWAYEINNLLYSSQKAHKHIWEETFCETIRQQVIDWYNEKLEHLLEIKIKNKDDIRMLKRIKKHKDEIFFFMNFPDLPFHNNDSEKAIRQAKVKQKVSWGFRSFFGAKNYAAILSVIETAKKHSFNLFHTIKLLIQGNFSFLPLE